MRNGRAPSIRKNPLGATRGKNACFCLGPDQRITSGPACHSGRIPRPYVRFFPCTVGAVHTWHLLTVPSRAHDVFAREMLDTTGPKPNYRSRTRLPRESTWPRAWALPPSPPSRRSQQPNEIWRKVAGRTIGRVCARRPLLRAGSRRDDQPQGAREFPFGSRVDRAAGARSRVPQSRERQGLEQRSLVQRLCRVEAGPESGTSSRKSGRRVHAVSASPRRPRRKTRTATTD